MRDIDADEAWTQIINSLRASLSGSVRGDSQSFIDDIMGVRLRTRYVYPHSHSSHCSQTCLENAEEPPTQRMDTVLKLECNISVSTNYLMSGIQEVSLTTYDTDTGSPSINRSKRAAPVSADRQCTNSE